MPCDVTIRQGEQVLVWTDVKAKMPRNYVLLLFIRSSLGIKKQIVLSNGTGVIDSSYYNNEDNDGNIGISLRNRSNETITLRKGERVMQGLFLKFRIPFNVRIFQNKRTGGIGSSGK